MKIYLANNKKFHKDTTLVPWTCKFYTFISDVVLEIKKIQNTYGYDGFGFRIQEASDEEHSGIMVDFGAYEKFIFVEGLTYNDIKDRL